MTPAELWCEYAVDPLGIDVPEPRFSWILDSSRRGEVQSAYRILVASSEETLRGDGGDKWDSGVVASDASVNVAYAGATLASGERCYWKVRVWDGHGCASTWSATATFEMGLLDRGDWNGTWISAEADLAAPLLRKEFTLDQPVARARLYLSGLGLYELSINGARVGDRVLDPALTDYRVRVPYVTHDLTRHLRRGRNVVGVMLGNGWYRGLSRQRFRFSDTLKLLLQLHVTAVDGTRTVVASDPTWQVAGGPITHNSLQEGEIYDARLEVPGWDAPGYDAEGWSDARQVEAPAGTLFSQLMPPMKVIETRHPERLTNPRAGVYVFDFGQLFGGWIRIRLQGAAGTRVLIKHSSRLRSDGTIDDDAYPGPHESDTCVLRGAPGGETYEPRFTFHPVHYVQFTGLPRPPELGDVEGKVVHTAVDPHAEFACSNELLNRIHRNVTWTMRNALKGFPMDCLHREPLGYNEPASVSSLLYTRRHMPLFWSKWLDDIKAARRPGRLAVRLGPRAARLQPRARRRPGRQLPAAGVVPVPVLRRPAHPRRPLPGDARLGGLPGQHRRGRPDHHRLARRPHAAGPGARVGGVRRGGDPAAADLDRILLPRRPGGGAGGRRARQEARKPPATPRSPRRSAAASTPPTSTPATATTRPAPRPRTPSRWRSTWYPRSAARTCSATSSMRDHGDPRRPHPRRPRRHHQRHRDPLAARRQRRRRNALRPGHRDHLSRLGLHGEPGRDHHLGVLGARTGRRGTSPGPPRTAPTA